MIRLERFFFFTNPSLWRPNFSNTKPHAFGGVSRRCIIQLLHIIIILYLINRQDVYLLPIITITYVPPDDCIIRVITNK